MPISSSAPPPGSRRRGGAARPAVLLIATLLAGCAMPEMQRLSNFGGTEPAATAPAPAPVATARPADPLAAFVGSAAPGSSGEVAGYGTVRLARAYTAASGRDCREAMIGRGAEERAVIYCRGPQGWAPARPLLRSGTLRP